MFLLFIADFHDTQNFGGGIFFQNVTHSLVDENEAIWAENGEKCNL